MWQWLISDIDVDLINNHFYEYTYCDPFIYGTSAVAANQVNLRDPGDIDPFMERTAANNRATDWIGKEFGKLTWSALDWVPDDSDSSGKGSSKSMVANLCSWITKKIKADAAAEEAEVGGENWGAEETKEKRDLATKSKADKA